MAFLQKIFGSNEREVKKFLPLVESINSHEPSISALSDEALKAKTAEFKERLGKGESLDSLLPEAYAVVREAAKRVINERHYDVQLMGGIALHNGKIAEMKTGEGKTLTSTLPIYLNALTGKGVHVVTVNDYLAKRDCNWMGRVYEFLGLSTACIVSQGVSYRFEVHVADSDEVSIEMENLIPVSRREAYQSDITYGTNNEFGFDYLRDNMVSSLEDMTQRELHFAIVDEVDSILIDEARTPLIISAPDTESGKLYERFAKIVPRLQAEKDYIVDEKMRVVTLTDEGINSVERLLGMGDLYASGNVQYVHHLEQSLKAEIIFARDRDYVVKDGQVIIVDDFTGRLQPGRRYSEGLHQAIEAKEGVTVQRETRTLATITFQNYFRLYDKLAGMTGTAFTSAEEFVKVYKLEAIEIPTNRPMVRKDLADIVYKTEEAKFRAIAKRVGEIHATGQPVLIGTIAIEKSEYLSALLTQEGITHEVLNAKNHEREAAIVSNAGQKDGVTIATNMAGRGTDIKLGDGVRERGGLFIIGTERHEARRIDNQLRGRAGRQGDPGASQFFISLEDELMRRFGGERMKNMMTTLGLPEDEPIQNKLISKTIESAQSKIEGYNFDIRKHVLEYDDVMNKQREVVYRKRKNILGISSMKDETFNLLSEELDRVISFHTAGDESDWQLKEIIAEANMLAPAINEIDAAKKLETIQNDRSKDEAEKRGLMLEYLIGEIKKAYSEKEAVFGKDTWNVIQRALYLRSLDTLWMNHLDEIDYLRQGIGLRGIAQKDPLIEYKREAYDMFLGLMDSVRKTYLMTILKVETGVPVPTLEQRDMRFQGASEEIEQFPTRTATQSVAGGGASDNMQKQAPLVNQELIGRNDPCPCGSGLKYKRCGAINAPEHKKLA
ncbi:MAG: preprotein translocase subunit SecA [Candidatus Moranbacteria bacterium RIFCSPHIGHO2_01_FULL_55_24]|nr:MAG: preprotein translocase subunit SecA [Candidatus Moranbacteria bacterium RIFCSPHIGHO2_01_FULL_55_24]